MVYELIDEEIPGAMDGGTIEEIINACLQGRFFRYKGCSDVYRVERFRIQNPQNRLSLVAYNLILEHVYVIPDVQFTTLEFVDVDSATLSKALKKSYGK